MPNFYGCSDMRYFKKSELLKYIESVLGNPVAWSKGCLQTTLLMIVVAPSHLLPISNSYFCDTVV